MKNVSVLLEKENNTEAVVFKKEKTLDNKTADAVALLENQDDFVLFGGDESFFSTKEESDRQDEVFKKANVKLLKAIDSFVKLLDNKRLSTKIDYSSYIKKASAIYKTFSLIYKKSVKNTGEASDESLEIENFKNKAKDLLDSFRLNKSVLQSNAIVDTARLISK
jgi:hypothetical protein